MNGTTLTHFTLWFRPTRRHDWRAVGSAPTHFGAVCLLGAGGERHGDWLILAGDRHPDAKPAHPDR